MFESYLCFNVTKDGVSNRHAIFVFVSPVSVLLNSKLIVRGGRSLQKKVASGGIGGTTIRKMKIDITILKLLLSISSLSNAIHNTQLQEAPVVKSNDTSLYITHHYVIKLIPYIEENDFAEDNYAKKFSPSFKQYAENQRARGKSVFFGRVKIYLTVTNVTKEIHLHASPHLYFDKNSIELFPIRISTDIFNTLYKHSLFYDLFYNNEMQTIILKFNKILLPLDYILTIDYLGPLVYRTDGFVKTFYINEEGNTMWVVAAGNFQALGARHLFPCWDKPELKTTFEISVKQRGTYTILSNSLFKETEYRYAMDERDNNKYNDKIKVPNDKVNNMWTQFKTTIAIRTHQIGIVILSKFAVFNTMHNVQIWHRQQVTPHVKFAQEVIKQITEYLYFILYYYSKEQQISNLRHVAIPGFQNEGMDNLNLILYREAALIYDKKVDPGMRKIEIARLIGYKIMQSLFGNNDCISSWSYLWLNEGIAIFFGIYVLDKIYPNFRMLDLYVVQMQQEALHLNEYYDMPLEVESNNTASEINSIISFPRYIKAPVFLYTLLHLVNSTYSTYPDDMYAKLLYRYLNIQCYSHKYNRQELNYTYNTFQNFLFNIKTYMHIINAKNMSHTINITEKLDCWVKQGYAPTVYVRRNYDDVLIKLENNLNKPLRDCWEYISFQIYGKKDTREYSRWLNTKHPIRHKVTLETHNFIIVNSQQAGYYRVYYDVQNWKSIANFFTKNYLRINVRNRAQIIDDAFFFLKKGMLRFSLFKKLTKYLSREKDYIAWYPMIKAIEYMSGFFIAQESTHIKKHIKNIMNNALSNIGYKESSNENDFTKCLRRELVKWACLSGSMKCRNLATKNLDMHLKNPKAYKFNPWWKKWIYCEGLKSANNITWHKVLDTWIKNSDNEILKSLACSNNSVIIKEYLKMIMSKQIIIKQNIERITYINSFYLIVAKHANNNEILNFILSHFNDLKPREISTVVVLIAIINHVNAWERIEMLKDFVLKNVNSQLILYVKRKLKKRVSDITKQTSRFLIL